MRVLGVLAASVAAVLAVAPPAGSISPTTTTLSLVIQHGAKVPILRAPASRRLAVAGWETPFGSVRRLHVVKQRGNWFAVESDVLGNGVVGWVPRTAAVRVQRSRFSV